MCGATTAQTNLQNQQAAFYQQATDEATAVYGQDQNLLKQITSVYAPILAKGPNQQGFSDAERADLNAQTVEGTAQNYAGASRALNENLAASGGGDIPLTSGQGAQLKGQVAASSAATQSEEESQIQQADYAQGYNLFQNAGNMMMGVSGQLNPTAYSGAAIGAGSAAASTANQIAQENNSWINAAIGAVGAGVGAWAGGGFKLPKWGNPSPSMAT
jgi:hypothetical protein